MPFAREHNQGYANRAKEKTFCALHAAKGLDH
jgi:hypothetical protein